MRNRAFLGAAVVSLLAAVGAEAQSPRANEWLKISEHQIGPRTAPALVWSPERMRFVVIGGVVSHEHKGDKPYDVLSFDARARQWENDLPKAAESRARPGGLVFDPGFKTPYFEMADREGLVRPHPHHSRVDYQYALAPWDGKVYALVCGRTLRYDPVLREWKDLQPAKNPTAPVKSYKETLNWGALCADPVNQEIVLVGGCGLANDGASPGIWVYSTAANTWKRLDAAVAPSPRALAPMVFDPVSERIVLFGGDGLDHLRGDTWVYDPKTRSWEERKPALSPSPRFGHALVALPKSRKVLLIGGKGLTSSTSYQALLYAPLPFEMWTYDVKGDAWRLVQRSEKDAPTQNPNQALAAAADDEDRVLLVSTRRYSIPPSTWLCAADTTKPDAEGTAKFGVKPGTVDYRTGPYDPDWYTRDVPPPDPKATADVLAELPANRWVALKCPKWPTNRMGGGWSTVALDTDRDQILHLGGGHSSYFGNDVAHYNIKTGRWSISYRPQFALDYNYDLSGPGPWAFNNAPWGNHNYHAYTYDATLRRLVFMRSPNYTLLYDPDARAWSPKERLETPFPVSKYTTYLCPTPEGTVAWTFTTPGAFSMGMFRLEKDRWIKLPVQGDPLPVSVTDGSTIAYDSKRRQLILTSAQPKEPAGQVWTYDLDSGRVTKKNPSGMDSIQVERFARESVYLPKADLVMLGYHLKKGNITPFYDVTNNRWLEAEVAGGEFFARKDGTGTSVDLGLTYDARRDLVWGVMCHLKGTGALNVLKIDAKELKLTVLR